MAQSAAQCVVEDGAAGVVLGFDGRGSGDQIARVSQRHGSAPQHLYGQEDKEGPALQWTHHPFHTVPAERALARA